MKYLLLTSLLVMFSFVSCGNNKNIESKEPSPILSNTNKITSKKAFEMLQKDSQIIVLDVRTPREFSQGHIKGAINLDISSRDFIENIGKINQSNKVYLVHCRTYHRSSTAVEYMLANGFILDNVYQIMDGFLGWSKNGLPIEK